MASAEVLQAFPTSFVYEDLVDRVLRMQEKTIEINRTIEQNLRKNTQHQRQLASRSFVFIDPFGNRITDQHLDHLCLGKIIQKYKKEYCPRYLHSWIKIGFFNSNKLQLLTENQSEQPASKYPDGQEFISFGEIQVLIVNRQCHLLEETSLNVRLTDTKENIRESIREYREKIRRKPSDDTEIELRVTPLDSSSGSNDDRWNRGKDLEDGQTIFSSQLYQRGTMLMVKINQLG